ncbi:Methyltransferase domain-containing protein [Paenibacillus sp. UNCCL117]|uniref:class I SAM-dependent methyltransferase n=1 Tax=unclassified Paenibacillus TaxID=185978 RepID=UPI00088CECDA|nr:MULTISPECIES: class I SAM-dependent methyltransferase [unclassified Paenibacillus]SDE22937.1 Methyltransferase domain-containing protein [Paenibacillus sp. cl123]SFW42778.1 Methyltransferase domain-containing protein [Paenibacillus sp. UNCCL117]
MENVIDYYSRFDEWGRLDREPLEFIINWHYMKTYLPPIGNVFDNGAGPGKYAMELAKLGYRVTLSDLTPRLVEMAKEKADELGIAERFNGFHVLNAAHLDGLPNEGFDASLMLGPLYHLQSEEERISAVRELFRVTKKGGIVFVAFQSRMRMTITSLQYPQHWKPNDTIDAIKEFRETGIFNHADKGRFTGAYYFDISEITPFMESQGFETVDLIGSSSIGGLITNEQRQLWEEKGESQRLMDLFIELAKDPYVLGTSSHLLYIGRRK